MIPPRPFLKPAVDTATPEIVAELRRVTALFQVRTIASIIGAPPPKPEDFKR